MVAAALTDQPIILVHTQRDASAVFEQQRHIFPEVLAPKAHQGIARSVSPTRCGHGLLHHGWMSARKLLHFLVVLVKRLRTIQELLRHIRGIIESRQAAALY